MKLTGRILGIGPTDNTSDQRTPRERLRIIPEAARESFVPYFPQKAMLRQNEADLTRLSPQQPRADGQPIEVSGVVRDSHGRPIRNGLVEVWNANKYGRYTHIEDHADLKLDPYFLGIGRILTDGNGFYSFWTISPGAYLARPDIGRWRPKHIHFSISGGSSRLITQMYFPNEENNKTDPMAILMGDDFERNIGKEYDTSSKEVDLGYRFDIVVGGPNSVFFE